MSVPGKFAVDRETDDRFRWARTVLKAPAEEPDRMRGFLLQRLADEDFALDNETRAAILTLCDTGSKEGIDDCPEEFRLHREQQLSEQIEEFAAAFFTLPCDDRKQRWLALRNKKELTAPQRVRLEALALGLAAIPERFESPSERVAQLAKLTCELFVLAPPVRAQRWREERVRMQSEIGEWSAAAAQLRKQNGGIAALQPDVLEELVRLDPAKQLWAQKLERQVRAERAEAAHREMVAAVNSTQDGEGWPTWLIAVIVMAAAGVFSAVLGGRDKNDRKTPSVPRFDLKTEVYRPEFPDWREFQHNPASDEARRREIRRLIESMKTRRIEPGPVKTTKTPLQRKSAAETDAELERMLIEAGVSKEARDRILRDTGKRRRQPGRIIELKQRSTDPPAKTTIGPEKTASPP